MTPSTQKHPGKYGPGIIGEEAFAEVELVQEQRPDKYGPGILGEEEYAKLTGERVEEADALTTAAERAKAKDPPTDPELDALVVKYASDDGYLSIGNVQTILEEMPNAFDRVFGWELNRKDGPRVGALNHLLKLEMKREGGPRHLVQQRIELALKETRGK